MLVLASCMFIDHYPCYLEYWLKHTNTQVSVLMSARLAVAPSLPWNQLVYLQLLSSSLLHLASWVSKRTSFCPWHLYFLSHCVLLFLLLGPRFLLLCNFLHCMLSVLTPQEAFGRIIFMAFAVSHQHHRFIRDTLVFHPGLTRRLLLGFQIHRQFPAVFFVTDFQLNCSEERNQTLIRFWVFEVHWDLFG